MSAGLTAKDIVEGLTVKQRTVALIGFIDAFVQLGVDKDFERFKTQMREVVETTERMLSEVPA